MLDNARILTREACEDIVTRIRAMSNGMGKTSVAIVSWWNGELRWARNRISLASDRRDIFVNVTRTIRKNGGGALTNQIDDVSLQAVVRAAERDAMRSPSQTPDDMPTDLTTFSTPTPTIWSDATYMMTSTMRGELSALLVERAEREGMLSAGYLEMRAAIIAASGNVENLNQGIAETGKPISGAQDGTRLQYTALTQAQCSMTVRHPKGTGSGWAGISSYDWSAVHGPALAARALEKCLSSLDPVRIEPGRYTVVLEPQAVSDLVDLIFPPLENLTPVERILAEGGRGAFVLSYDSSLKLWRSKLGLKVVDKRITIYHDPMDPQLGVIPKPGLDPVTWIDRGILNALTYERRYAVSVLTQNAGVLERPAYRMSGGTTTIDEMIATTKRGLLVSRFSNLRVLDTDTLLSTGVTRDGLWLIESGAITKAVKNMRVTESPLFVLNQVDQLGVPVPVFRPEKYSFSARLSPAVVPPIKSHDFSFTATIDAI